MSEQKLQVTELSQSASKNYSILIITIDEKNKLKIHEFSKYLKNDDNALRWAEIKST